jgi:6-phosphofructokinase 1
MDRALCTIFGTKAIELVAEERFGEMVAFTGNQVASVPIIEAVGKLRTVPLDGGFVTSARSLGICLGD